MQMILACSIFTVQNVMQYQRVFLSLLLLKETVAQIISCNGRKCWAGSSSASVMDKPIDRLVDRIYKLDITAWIWGRWLPDEYQMITRWLPDDGSTFSVNPSFPSQSKGLKRKRAYKLQIHGSLYLLATMLKQRC